MSISTELDEAILDWYYKKHQIYGDGFYLSSFEDFDIKYSNLRAAKQALKKAQRHYKNAEQIKR